MGENREEFMSGVAVGNDFATAGFYRGKVVVITGGGGGIGQAIKEKFVSMGADVVLVGRKEKELRRQESAHVKYILWDITNLARTEEKIREAAGCFGKIDIWVNNAGVISENDLIGDFFHATEEDWDSQFNVNAKAMYFITQAMCRYYLEKKIQNAHIVQILSIGGMENTWRIYGLSKRVGFGITKGIAKLAAPYGIIINGVAPGEVLTNMIAGKLDDPHSLKKNSVPSGRMSTPAEIAGIVCFLASDTAAQQVGNIIVCDGGDIL